MTLYYQLSKPLDVVFRHLAEAYLFVKVHPVIYKCEQVGENQYKFYEKQYIGFIAYNFTYIVTITSNPTNNEIRMTALVMRLLKIDLKFELSEQQGKTHVCEFVNLSSFFPIRFLVNPIFRTIHKKIFENIENL